MNEAAPLRDLQPAESDTLIEAPTTRGGIITEALRLAKAGFHVGITSPDEKRPHPERMIPVNYCLMSPGGRHV